MLLRGYRMYCLAGNDAHGNFNRFRQIGIPFVSIRESDAQLFGKMRTAVFLDRTPGTRSVLDALARGAFIISDGPCVNITASTTKDSPALIGQVLKMGKQRLKVSAVSTSEFGSLSDIVVYGGVVSEERERVLLHQRLSDAFSFEAVLPVPGHPYGYLRAEAHTSPDNLSDKRPHFCFTTPIWFADDRRAH